jgi:chromosome segregation ATPase
MSDLSRLLAQADDVNRGVETLDREAQRTVESLQEPAQQAERELRAMVNQVGDLLSEIDTIQSRAEVLRRMIGEMESRANHKRRATREAVETGVLESQQQEAIHQQLLMRLADCQKLLAKLKELAAHLQERRMLLGHLQKLAREWTEVIMRVRHLARN